MISTERIHDANPTRLHQLESSMHRVLSEDMPSEELHGFLLSYRQGPFSGEVLAKAAAVLRDYASPLHSACRPRIDTCGTGGDGQGTFNISTAAALTVSAAGGAVAKHGNRNISSKTGSADVLEALGFSLEHSGKECARLLDATGFAFLYAPDFHPATRRVQAARKALGIPTIFNLMGPLTNPARPEYQVVGVASLEHAEPMVRALQHLGCQGALVVHCRGMDELGLHAPTHGFRLVEGEITPIAIEPEDYGMERASIESLAGGDSQDNAEILLEVFEGAPGPHADVVALNAGAALMVAGMCANLGEGIERSRTLFATGAVLQVIRRYQETSARLKEQR